MSVTTFRSATSDISMSSSGYGGLAYATVRDGYTYTRHTSYEIRCGQSYSSLIYYVYRLFLSFNTASIPDDDTVTAVSLGLKISTDYTEVADFTMYVYDYNWNAAASDANLWDMGTAGATDSTAANKETPEVDVAGKTVGDWVIFTGLDTSWVKKTTTTNYAFRSKEDADGSGSAPTGREYLMFYSADHATESNRPYLQVTHGSVTGTRTSLIYAQGILSPCPLNPLA